MGRRILLTGGTGFIGGALAAALRERGDEVVVVSRRGPVTWNEVEGHVAAADAVVHLAGEPVTDGRWTRERFARIRSSRVDTTARLAAAMAGGRGARVFVSGSAVGIYGTRTDDAVCDEDTAAGEDALAKVCVEWEAAARPAAEAGVRVAHPRVGIVLGRGGALAKMSGAYRWFVGGPVGSGTQWVSWVHVKDVVGALLLLLDRDDLSGPFDVTAPTPVTMNDFAAAIGRSLGRPSAMRVPAFALRLALGEGLAEALLTGQRAVPRRLLDSGFAFSFTDVGEALRDLR
jgi:uncharacterized protein (TIGR01777 family)